MHHLRQVALDAPGRRPRPGGRRPPDLLLRPDGGARSATRSAGESAGRRPSTPGRQRTLSLPVARRAVGVSPSRAVVTNRSARPAPPNVTLVTAHRQPDHRSSSPVGRVPPHAAPAPQRQPDVALGVDVRPSGRPSATGTLTRPAVAPPHPVPDPPRTGRGCCGRCPRSRSRCRPPTTPSRWSSSRRAVPRAPAVGVERYRAPAPGCAVVARCRPRTGRAGRRRRR